MKKPGERLLIIVFVLMQSAFIILINLLQKENSVVRHPLFVSFFYLFVVAITVKLSLVITKEIRQRKKTEKKLQNYIDLIDHTPIFIRNMQDEIISWNKGMEKLYGWPENETIGKVCHQLFATVFPKPLEDINNYLLFNNHWQGELKHTVRNNKIIHVCSHWSLIRDEKGYATVIMETINDVTALKEKEKQVASLAGVLNKSNDAIYTVDTNHKIKTWNKGAEKLYGYSFNEAVGHNSNVLLATSISDTGIELIEQQMNEKDYWAGELKRKTKQGSEVRVAVSASPIRENGKITGFTSVSYDNKKEIKLRAQLVHLSKLLDQSNDAIYTTGLDQKIKTWNKGAEKLYGFTRKEALGCTPAELLQEGTTAPDPELVTKQLTELNYWMGDLKRKTKQGNDIHVYTSASPLRDDDGAVTGYISASHDITDKIKLREQVTHLATLADQSADGIISVSMEGRILSWNKGAESLYGYKAHEAIGENIFIIIPPERVNEERSIIEKIKKNIPVADFETLRIKKDGTRIPVSLSVSQVSNSKGEIIAVSGITRDISARKETEQKIIQSEENLKAVFENASEAFVLTDAAGFIKAYNKRAEQTIFINTKEKIFPGKSVFDLIAVSRHDFFKQLYADVLAGKTIQYDHSFSNPAGGSNWMNFTCNPVKNNQGIITGICIAGRDVTAMKNAEQQKEFDGNNLSALINNTNDLMWSVSRDFKLITSNQAFDEMNRRMSGKIIEKGGDIFTGQFSDLMQDRYRQFYERAFAGEAFTTTEYTFASFEYWSENSFFPIYEGGAVVGTACFSRDISAQKKAGQLLQQSFNDKQMLADRMYTILNTLPANIALLNDTGIIIDVNDTWKNFADGNRFQGSDYGIGQNYVTVAERSFGNDASDGKSVASGIRSVLEKKEKEFVFEYPCHSALTKRWFRMVVTPYKNQEHSGAVVMHLDITEIRQLYQDKLQYRLDEQKKLTRVVLMAREKERNQLGRDLHDNICQMLAVLKMKLDYCVVTKSIDIALVQEATGFLEEAINETRDISHRMIIPRFAESSLTDALASLGHTYTHEKRKVSLDCVQDDEKKIPVDVKEALYRIAQEKLNNIHKYAEASFIKVAVRTQKNVVTMTIEDNGVGFDTSKKKSGVGITNIISRAESLNGSAKIISSIGKGCRLLVEIPLCDKKEKVT